MGPVQIGIIGCGVISDSYLRGAAGSRLIKVKAVADLKIGAAQARAAAYGVEAVSVDALLNDPDIDIVLNLTVPLVHAQVSRQVIAAGKHVYSEKAARHRVRRCPRPGGRRPGQRRTDRKRPIPSSEQRIRPAGASSTRVASGRS